MGGKTSAVKKICKGFKIWWLNTFGIGGLNGKAPPAMTLQVKLLMAYLEMTSSAISVKLIGGFRIEVVFSAIMGGVELTTTSAGLETSHWMPITCKGKFFNIKVRAGFFPPSSRISSCVRTVYTVMCLHTWRSPAIGSRAGSDSGLALSEKQGYAEVRTLFMDWI